MNCTEVQRLLSAYHDGELVGDRQLHVREHLSQCEQCAEDQRCFQELSTLAHAVQTPTPPAAIWDRLETELDKNTVSRLAGGPWMWVLRDSRVLTLAATILVAAGLGWFAYGTWLRHGDHRGMVAEFGHYLEAFRRDPDEAQQMLVAKYNGKSVDSAQAFQLVGYHPVTASRLHKEFKVKSTHVLNMPCCTCVQTVCQRSDGSTVVIFEHDEDTPGWFGDRQKTMADCSGKRCRLFDVNDRIAASWKSGSRYITVIGVRDAAEVSDLVAWLEGFPPDNSS